jgi:hypothetical protein
MHRFFHNSSQKRGLRKQKKYIPGPAWNLDGQRLERIVEQKAKRCGRMGGPGPLHRRDALLKKRRLEGNDASHEDLLFAEIPRAAFVESREDLLCVHCRLAGQQGNSASPQGLKPPLILRHLRHD